MSPRRPKTDGGGTFTMCEPIISQCDHSLRLILDIKYGNLTFYEDE